MKSDLLMWLGMHPMWAVALLMAGASIGVFVMALLAVAGGAEDDTRRLPTDHAHHVDLL